VDEVAEIPEAIPVALVHLLLVERQHRCRAVLDRGLERRRPVGQTPDAEYAGRVQVGRSGGEQRQLRAAFRHRRPVAGFVGIAPVGKSVSSLVRATPNGVLRPGCTSS
jgi:hypothetical protein